MSARKPPGPLLSASVEPVESRQQVHEHLVLPVHLRILEGPRPPLVEPGLEPRHLLPHRLGLLVERLLLRLGVVALDLRLGGLDLLQAFLPRLDRLSVRLGVLGLRFVRVGEGLLPDRREALLVVPAPREDVLGALDPGLHVVGLFRHERPEPVRLCH